MSGEAVGSRGRSTDEAGHEAQEAKIRLAKTSSSRPSFSRSFTDHCASGDNFASTPSTDVAHSMLLACKTTLVHANPRVPVCVCVCAFACAFAREVAQAALASKDAQWKARKPAECQRMGPDDKRAR
ncbi:MAG: hypothetical protein ACPIOQ_65745 [Promethearchaeia archaeon]